MIHTPIHSALDDVVVRLVRAQKSPLGAAARVLLFALGIDIDRKVKIGRRLTLLHSTFGLVIHVNTTIGNDVTIYHGVTIGRADPWNPPEQGGPSFTIGDHAVLCAGAVIVTPDGSHLTVGRGTVVAANSVLTHSTGEDEIWAGIPARRVNARR